MADYRRGSKKSPRYVIRRMRAWIVSIVSSVLVFELSDE